MLQSYGIVFFNRNRKVRKSVASRNKNCNRTADESLYLETGWENVKLMKMYKIHCNLVLRYLAFIVDNCRKNSLRYSTRHLDDYKPPRTKLELYNKFCFPDAIRK
jgi:hypothetical protein